MVINCRRALNLCYRRPSTFAPSTIEHMCVGQNETPLEIDHQHMLAGQRVTPLEIDDQHMLAGQDVTPVEREGVRTPGPVMTSSTVSPAMEVMRIGMG